MVNIMFEKTWAKAAEGLSKSAKEDKKDEKKENKTKTAFTLNQIVEGNTVIYFLLPDLHKLGGDSVNPLTALLFE